jgi:hypothetical protein
LGRSEGTLRIFLPSDIPGTSPPTSLYLPPICISLWAPALMLGSPCGGLLLYNKLVLAFGKKEKKMKYFTSLKEHRKSKTV